MYVMIKKSVSPCCWLDGLLPTATLLHQVAVQLNNVHKRLRGTYFLRTVCARRLTFRSISYVNGADVFSIRNLGVFKNLQVFLRNSINDKDKILGASEWKLKHFLNIYKDSNKNFWMWTLYSWSKESMFVLRTWALEYCTMASLKSSVFGSNLGITSTMSRFGLWIFYFSP